MSTMPISNTEDIIDSRDVIARIEELEEIHAAECAFDSDDNCPTDDKDHEHVDCPDFIEHEELNALKALADEASGYAEDWLYGATLVRDSYFEQHARDEADSIGAIDHRQEYRWPFTCIDWEKAADELKQDYTEVLFDDVAYWIR